MPDVQEALELVKLLEEVGDRIKEVPRGRSYLSPDGRAFVIAFGGDEAEAMSDFIKAVGQYLTKVKRPRTNKEAAKEEVVRAFEEWLSKQKL